MFRIEAYDVAEMPVFAKEVDSLAKALEAMCSFITSWESQWHTIKILGPKREMISMTCLYLDALKKN